MSERHGDHSGSAENESSDPEGDGCRPPDSGMDAVIDDVEERTTAMIGRLKEKLPHKSGNERTDAW